MLDGFPSSVSHQHTSTPVPTTQRRQGFDDTVVDEDDVLQAIAGHVGQVDPGIGKGDIGKFIERAALDRARLPPASPVILKEAFETGARSQSVGHTVAVEVEESDLGVLQIYPLISSRG